MLGMNGAVRAWVTRIPSESGTCQYSKTNLHIQHVQEGLLEPIVPSTAEVPCRPMRCLQLPESTIKGPLIQSNTAKVLLLLELPLLLSP